MLLAREVLLEQPSCSIPYSRGNSTLERKLVDNDMQHEAGALARSVGEGDEDEDQVRSTGGWEGGIRRVTCLYASYCSVQHPA